MRNNVLNHIDGKKTIKMVTPLEELLSQIHNDSGCSVIERGITLFVPLLFNPSILITSEQGAIVLGLGISLVIWGFLYDFGIIPLFLITYCIDRVVHPCPVGCYGANLK